MEMHVHCSNYLVRSTPNHVFLVLLRCVSDQGATIVTKHLKKEEEEDKWYNFELKRFVREKIKIQYMFSLSSRQI